MIKKLQLTNVGPAQKMELEFADRLNIITGDNGLGKSFLLDIAWWALTRTWPAEVNPKLTMGLKAFPDSNNDAEISAHFKGELDIDNIVARYRYHRQTQQWTPATVTPTGEISQTSLHDPRRLVIYAMADGSFAVWDRARNFKSYYSNELSGGSEFEHSLVGAQDRPRAYIFNQSEVWNGLTVGEKNEKYLCNGLIRDWVGWQKENSYPFDLLKKVLATLSPSNQEKLLPGKWTRISLDDVRDMPTIQMPYNKKVPLAHASSGIRRILALAYMLVWTWEEHKLAAKLLHEETAASIVLLIDEIEAHLHPHWQRQIVRAMLKVTKSLSREANLQLITTTHAPLVMASIEPFFEAEKDAWFDLDLEDEAVVLRQREFEKRGDANNWLTSDAFDLSSSRPVEYEELTKKASDLLENPETTPQKIKETYQMLIKALNPKDSFLFSWRYIAQKKGLLK